MPNGEKYEDWPKSKDSGEEYHRSLCRGPRVRGLGSFLRYMRL
jgi:hypothetical protein